MALHQTPQQPSPVTAKEFEEDKRVRDSGVCQIIREDSKVKFILYSIDESGSVDKTKYEFWVFDTKKSYSLVETRNVQVNTEFHTVLDYEEHNGVFVPNKMTSTLITEKQSDNPSQITRNITFTTESVNEKISPSEFQYEKLGLRPGDFILDHSAGGLHYNWRSDEDLENTVDAAVDAKIHSNEVIAVSPNQDKHSPKKGDVIKTLPADDNTEQKQDEGIYSVYIIIIAILAAIAICIAVIKMLRRNK